MARPVRVVLVDDFEIVREGLRSMLGREPDIDVLGIAADAEEGADMIAELKPDVAVIDYGLPGMSGTELCGLIIERHPEVKVVMLTTFLDDAVVRSAIEAGASAYVYKDVEGKDLKRAIRSVMDGESVLDPKVVGRVMRWVRRDMPQLGAPLADREIEVLRYVSRGATNDEIARAMHVSPNTVKTYVARVMNKLGCNSRAEAASVAAKRGLL